MRLRSCLPLCLVLLLAGWSSPAFAKSYRAERFDVRIALDGDGAARVTETVVFRFVDGQFTQVDRAIPGRRTDGIDQVTASMDGAPLGTQRSTRWAEIKGEPPGNGNSGNFFITWHFEPTANSSHEFALTYRVRGVSVPEQNADLFAWTVLPAEHAYEIRSSEVSVELPAGAGIVGTPTIDLLRMAEPDVRAGGNRLTVSAVGLGPDATYTLRVRTARGAVARAAPAWRVREEQMAEDAPMVMALAAALGVAGLLVFLFFWITIPRTSRPMTVGPGWETAPPDDLPPALASALLSRGASGGSGLIATVVDLARRGAIEIVEVSTDRWRGRKYRLVPTRAAVHEAHERAVLRSLFRGESTGGVDLAAGIRHARRGEGTHREAVAAELLRRRLVSPERIAGKRRLIGVSIALAVIAGMALVVGIVLVSRAGGAVMLPALALGLVAFIGVLVSATFSVLSDEGLRVETRWRGFRKHLNRIAKGRHAIPAEVMDEWLPYAVGLGLGLRWAKQRSKMAERSPMPAWLVPLLQSNGSNGALAALLVAGGANAGAGGAAGAGAAAGGGSSGAS